MKINNKESTWENLRLLLNQVLVTTIFVVIIGFSAYYINLLSSYGRPGLVFLTLILSIVIDQIKSVGFLYCIYIIVVRRFMHLNVNEHEYLKPEILALPKQENALPILKGYLLKILESTIFEIISMCLISVYAVFVLF